MHVCTWIVFPACFLLGKFGSPTAFLHFIHLCPFQSKLAVFPLTRFSKTLWASCEFHCGSLPSTKAFLQISLRLVLLYLGVLLGDIALKVLTALLFGWKGSGRNILSLLKGLFMWLNSLLLSSNWGFREVEPHPCRYCQTMFLCSHFLTSAQFATEKDWELAKPSGPSWFCLLVLPLIYLIFILHFMISSKKKPAGAFNSLLGSLLSYTPGLPPSPRLQMTIH